MAKVLGLGGIFFKAKDPKALLAWYQKALGMSDESGYYVSMAPEAMPPGGATLFTPFKEDTTHFAPSTRDFMFNLVVDDLDGALAQVEAHGATLSDPIQEADYGRFGWFIDPDGNKVELWQPKVSA